MRKITPWKMGPTLKVAGVKHLGSVPTHVRPKAIHVGGSTRTHFKGSPIRAGKLRLPKVSAPKMRGVRFPRVSQRAQISPLARGRRAGKIGFEGD